MQAETAATRRRQVPKLEDRGKSHLQRFLVGLFVALPFAAVATLVVLAARLDWSRASDLAIIAVTVPLFYCVTLLGIGGGFHRLFTHRSFKARRGLKVALAVSGSLGAEGRLDEWVAEHRRHHQFSDQDGDPHSPWRYGEGFWALARGMLHAHTGWLFDKDRTSIKGYAPDMIEDRDLRRVSNLFPYLTVLSLVLPAAIGLLIGWSWHGALTGFIWGGLIRIGLLHHVTWSINSICHTFGERQFESNDKSMNVAWMAVISFGESWHNLHHADPTCARHGALPGQVDITAWFIRQWEKRGWAYDVRWPKPDRLAAKLVKPQLV